MFIQCLLCYVHTISFFAMFIHQIHVAFIQRLYFSLPTYVSSVLCPSNTSYAMHSTYKNMVFIQHPIHNQQPSCAMFTHPIQCLYYISYALFTQHIQFFLFINYIPVARDPPPKPVVSELVNNANQKWLVCWRNPDTEESVSGKNIY